MIPKRVCPRFSDLTLEEVNDLFQSAHRIAPKLELQYKCSALNIAIQDGIHAGSRVYHNCPLMEFSFANFKTASSLYLLLGQSVAHVHVHLLPRKAADFVVSDDVYEELDRQDLNNAFDPSRPRPYRTIDEMAAESIILRSALLGARVIPGFDFLMFCRDSNLLS